jgi:hypothetical protein
MFSQPTRCIRRAGPGHRTAVESAVASIPHPGQQYVAIGFAPPAAVRRAGGSWIDEIGGRVHGEKRPATGRIS